jgi:hypothetical protein
MLLVDADEDDGEDYSFLSPSTSHIVFPFDSPSFGLLNSRQPKKSLSASVHQELFLTVEKFGTGKDSVLIFNKYIDEKPVFHSIP